MLTLEVIAVGDVLDLTAVAVTTDLLLEPLRWRERVVEEVVLDSADYVRRRRTLQVSTLREVLALDDRESTEARLILPLLTLEKRPLPHFDVRSPHDDAVLLRRFDGARREAALVVRYLDELDLPVSEPLEGLLREGLAFDDGAWRAVQATSGPGSRPWRRFLEQGLGDTVDRQLLGDLLLLGDRAAEVLQDRTDVPDDSVSAVAQPLLLVPRLLGEGYVDDLHSAVTLIEAYVYLLDQVAARVGRESPSAADDVLSVLADYGHRWEAFLDLTVPLDRPFLVGLDHVEVAPLGLRGARLRSRTTVPLVVADASSIHVAVRVKDPAAQLRRVVARRPHSHEEAFFGSTSSATRELHTFYAWERDRDFRVELQLDLAPLLRVWLGQLGVCAVVVLVAVSLVVRRPSQLTELLVVVGPTAAAAGLLLSREPSTLGSRLRLPLTVLLAAAVGALTAVAAWRFATL